MRWIFFEASRPPSSRSHAGGLLRESRGLHLHYEQAQTRFQHRQNRWYNLSTHLPWIGMRTAGLEGAHVEYFADLQPHRRQGRSAMDAAWLQGLVTTLNRRISPAAHVHTPLGAKEVAAALPKAIEASARPVRRCCGCAIP